MLSKDKGYKLPKGSDRLKYGNTLQVFKDYIKKTLSYHLDYPLVKPERVNIATTFKCPLSCEMCTIPDSDGDRKTEMKTEEWKDIIDEIEDWGVQHVSFSGGETLIEKDKTIELMEYSKKRGLEIDLITNGCFMDEDTVKKVLNTGVDRISLSVDGATEKVHDSIRGEGSFSDIKKAIDNLNEYRDMRNYVEYEFTTVVMNRNYHELVDIYNLMKESGFDYINYQALIPDNSFEVSQSYNDNLWLDSDEVEELEGICEKLMDIKSRTGDIRNTKKYLNILPRYFGNREDFRYGKCMAGYEVVHIDPYGNIDLCGFGPSINVRDGNLEEKWKGGEYKELRKKVKKCERPCLLLCYRKLDLQDMFKTHVEASIDEI